MYSYSHKPTGTLTSLLNLIFLPISCSVCNARRATHNKPVSYVFLLTQTNQYLGIQAKPFQKQYLHSSTVPMLQIYHCPMTRGLWGCWIIAADGGEAKVSGSCRESKITINIYLSRWIDGIKYNSYSVRGIQSEFVKL